MTGQDYLKLLRELGVSAWNEERERCLGIVPDVIEAFWSRPCFIGADLNNMDLKRIYLWDASLEKSNLSYADLRGADLRQANISNANLTSARLSHANLRSANLTGADLSSANFVGTIFGETKLRGAKVYGAKMGWTVFGEMDLSETEGLETVTHLGPSIIGIDTLYKSKGKIPAPFLRGAGLPDNFITSLPSIIEAQQATQSYSCFISYNSRDEEFAKRLYSRLEKERIRVWFAPEDVKGGRKLHEQIDRAIQLHDRLLIVLSKHSLSSEWVMTEIRKARQVEIKSKRRKLFPIRLVDMETIRGWECFDADTGKDLAVEVREYFIPDFSRWIYSHAFETTFQRLLRDLKA